MRMSVNKCVEALNCRAVFFFPFVTNVPAYDGIHVDGLTRRFFLSSK